MESAPLGGFANLSAQQLAALTFSSIETVRRWRRTGLAPPLVVAWLDLLHYGPLARMHHAWEGWHLRDGQLHAPNGWTFDTGELLALPIRYQEIAALRRQLAAASLAKAPVCSTRRRALFTRHTSARTLREDEHAPSGAG